jgi:hypothetical protein
VTLWILTDESQHYCCLDIISCSLVGRCQCFGGTCCLHLQSLFYPEEGGRNLVCTYHTKCSHIAEDDNHDIYCYTTKLGTTLPLLFTCAEFCLVIYFVNKGYLATVTGHGLPATCARSVGCSLSRLISCGTNTVA